MLIDVVYANFISMFIIIFISVKIKYKCIHQTDKNESFI